ncbi:MAG: ABC transporter ATP-binding protein [Solirubrobacteraceae bacterium]
MSFLEVEGLSVRLGGAAVLSDVSFTLERGERVGLIGESGSGKSMTALAVIGLLPDHARVQGRILLEGTDLQTIGERRRCAVRGDRIAMVFQEPMTALNPTMRVGRQVEEVIALHQRASRQEATRRALELLHRVEFPDPERVARAYPHQLSGGQRQRIMVAMAVACGPSLILADEPTTALDVTVQAQVLRLLSRLVAEEDAALLLISHDLAVVSSMCERLLVMYGGHLVERGPSAELLSRPAHPYTGGLLATSAALTVELEDQASVLPTIPGSVPALGHFPSGCAFRSRCARADGVCETEPQLGDGERAAACWHPLSEPTAVGGPA